MCMFYEKIMLLLAILLATTLRPSESNPTALKRISKCQDECSRSHGSVVLYKPWSRKRVFKECFHRCALKVIQREHELNAIQEGKDYKVLKPHEPLPPDLHFPSQIPQLPKDLQANVDQALLTYGNCSIVGAEKVDFKLQDVILSKFVTVTCNKQNNGIMVKWRKAKELKNCIGYQINYRFSNHEHANGEKGHCFEVGRGITRFLIDKEKGFNHQEELHLAVAALPLPRKCNINMKKYPLCKGGTKSRSKRSFGPPPGLILNGSDPIPANLTKPSVIPPFNPKTPDFIIIKSGDPVPTNLTMPSVMPSFPFPGGKQSNCQNTPIGSKKESYAGYANIDDVKCQKAGNFSKKRFIVYWEPPKDYLKVNYTHFQILYSITPENVIPNPTRINCHEVSKNTYSYTVADVEATDTIHVLVVAFPTYHKLEEPMKKFQPCKTPIVTSPDPQKSITKELVSGLVAAFVVVAAAVFVVVFLRRRKGPPPDYPEKKARVYVSYFPDSKRYMESVLSFVAKFREKYSINLIMDSYCQVEVSELGLARWCQQQLSLSNRVLMILSKEYIKVAEGWKNGETDKEGSTDENRVCSELQFIVEKIFERRKNSLLTIVLADVKPKELPDFLRGKQTFSWPKNSDEESAIACSICGVEGIAVA